MVDSNKNNEIPKSHTDPKINKNEEEKDATRTNPASWTKMLRKLNLKHRKKPGRGDVNDPNYVIDSFFGSWDNW